MLVILVRNKEKAKGLDWPRAATSKSVLAQKRKPASVEPVAPRTVAAWQRLLTHSGAAHAHSRVHHPVALQDVRSRAFAEWVQLAPAACVPRMTNTRGEGSRFVIN